MSRVATARAESRAPVARAKTLARARAEERTVTIAETRATVECLGITLAEVRARLRAGARVERETVDAILGDVAQVLLDVEAVLELSALLGELAPSTWKDAP
jgi:hypothetical protein